MPVIASPVPTELTPPTPRTASPTLATHTRPAAEQQSSAKRAPGQSPTAIPLEPHWAEAIDAATD